jgi:glutamate synthase domain-containing protein 1/glutamate synthase domain-containing protein 3
VRADVLQIIQSRASLVKGLPLHVRKREAEGGCGVLGLACTVPVAGRHLLPPMRQMHNRGNGKGGGIAAVGLDPKQMGVSRKVLQEDYLLMVAYLDPSCRPEVEEKFIHGPFEVDHQEALPTRHLEDVPGLEVEPPMVCRYFVRPREDRLRVFARETGLEGLERSVVEDEYVYRNSFRLNVEYYASLGEKRAFVLSHGKDMMVLKIVGYAEQVIQYYRLEDIKAHVWIGHQRYPTKGRVWHPGGAHPFVGLHEALVHNGDFANYARVTKYLRQRNIVPLFLTDTEVSVLLFDLLRRTYGYPLEWVIEAMAPTTERDFAMLPSEKRALYRKLQAAHIHGSPDGPWFFIIARREHGGEMQLIGITDTSMLRPQVFALQEGDASIGMVASEKQAIDAILRSLSEEDDRFWPVADRYWNARGGSYTNGGAFLFSLKPTDGGLQLRCTDKFGKEVRVTPPSPKLAVVRNGGREDIPMGDPAKAATRAMAILREADLGQLQDLADSIVRRGLRDDETRSSALEVLTRLLDRPYPMEVCRRSRARAVLEEAIETLLDACDGRLYERVDWDSRSRLGKPGHDDRILVVDAADFPAEDEESVSRFIAEAYHMGWRRIIAYRHCGQRFVGCGLGPESRAEIHVYGSCGDYLASGLDGSTVHVHGTAQDQAAQIMKGGRLVIHGDVGQTFMYGAKGGEAYVLGNAAGRPLINAVGRPRVVINGTALDYLAESFMAGDPMKDGGFVILNGLAVDEQGHFVDLETPYEGGNLFSLASGGALYIRDPTRVVDESQLNGGRFAELKEEDWQLIYPYLKANEELLGVPVERLLTFRGRSLRPSEAYRKVEAVPLKALIPAHD